MQLKKLAKSFHYAFQGIHYAFRSQQNVRIHAGVAVLVIVASLYFHVTEFEFSILLVMILLVLATEMLNTAIEKIVDLIIKEHHEDAKIAKDVSAGMVLITVIGAVIVGLLVFIPYIRDFLF